MMCARPAVPNHLAAMTGLWRKGKEEEEAWKSEGREAALGAWRLLSTHLVCAASLAGCCWVLDTTSISLEPSDANIHK